MPRKPKKRLIPPSGDPFLDGHFAAGGPSGIGVIQAVDGRPGKTGSKPLTLHEEAQRTLLIVGKFVKRLRAGDSNKAAALAVSNEIAVELNHYVGPETIEKVWKNMTFTERAHCIARNKKELDELTTTGKLVVDPESPRRSATIHLRKT